MSFPVGDRRFKSSSSILPPAVIRSRERGDYLTITRGAGSMAHKSLKDYMISEKIPRQLRDRIPFFFYEKSGKFQFPKIPQVKDRGRPEQRLRQGHLHRLPQE